jgi:hypothetical protein
MGDVKISETWPNGQPKRFEHKIKLDALTLLAKMRGLVVDRLDIKGLQDSDASLDRLIEAELDRVRGRLPSDAQVVDAEAVTPTDAVPTLDPAGLAANDTPSD